ncbi:hypothetical protein H0H93_008902 [Arthromyces matolae]|nr:hypothetical protein H0H93_008902 [Arthromyces matolae]
MSQGHPVTDTGPFGLSSLIPHAPPTNTIPTIYQFTGLPPYANDLMGVAHGAFPEVHPNGVVGTVSGPAPSGSINVYPGRDDKGEHKQKRRRTGDDEKLRSCIANVSRRFDRPSFSLHLYAARTIEAGEELCVNYSSTYHPRSQRQSKLLPYGFHCTCPACSDPNFDSRLAGVMRSYAKLYSRLRGLENTQEALDESLVAIEEIEALGLEEQAGYYKHLSRAAVMAGLLKKKELSTMLLEKIQKRQMMATGKPLMNLAAADMKQLMDRARESNGWVIKAF